MSAAPTAPAPRGRRSWGQRLLLSVGVVVTTLVLLVASLVAWSAYKLRQIDREDVVLDELVAGGPTNYLIVGSDSRSDGDPLDPSAADTHAPLADTIMVLRIDPGGRGAKLLSLPRDLWVTLPDGDQGRINAAYRDDPQDLIDTVRDELGVPINHYVEIDFGGFQEVVSAIDGVPLWFDRAMRDRNTGLDVTATGCQVLDGRSALAFARSRHLQVLEDGRYTYDGTGDLGRITRQQLFIRRVIDRAKDKGVGNPVTLKRLVDVGAANLTIDDDLAVSELLALGRRFASFDSGALETYTLPTTTRRTDGGAQVEDLVVESAEPILGLFRLVGPQAADPGAAGGSGAPAPSTSLVDPSEVTLDVLNASGRSGLAAEVGAALSDDGFDVDDVGNGADRGHAEEARTIVRHGAGSSAEARVVAAALSGDALVEFDGTLGGLEVELYLGADFTGLTGSTVSPVGGGTTPSAPITTTSTTSTTAPEQSDPIGVVPGEPPAGTSCG